MCELMTLCVSECTSALATMSVARLLPRRRQHYSHLKTTLFPGNTKQSIQLVCDPSFQHQSCIIL